MANPVHITDAERDLIIRSLTTHGRTARQTAEIVGRPERAVRQVAKAAGLTLARNHAVKQNVDISLSLSPPLHAALKRAAYWRDMAPEVLAVQILHGVITKGSIHRTLAGQPLHHHTAL
jgi:hypothetical protein